MREHAAKLNAVGFEWKPQKNCNGFNAKFKELVEYKKAFGNVDVPCNNSKNTPYKNLGRWLAALRVRREKLDNQELDGAAVDRKNDFLTSERIQVSLSDGIDLFMFLLLLFLISFMHV